MSLSSITGDKDRHISLFIAINVKNHGGFNTPELGKITHCFYSEFLDYEWLLLT